MAHVNTRPSRTSTYALPYPGQVESDPALGDIVKVLSGDLRGDFGIVQNYVLGSVKPYEILVGHTSHYFSAPQLLPVI